MLVVLLLGIVFSREPRLQRTEEIFLRWLIKNATVRNQAVPLTIIEVGGKPDAQQGNTPLDATENSGAGPAARIRH